MPKKKSAPTIKVAGLFGGKSRSELVQEAKQRRLVKIQNAKDAAETKRQEAMAKKLKKDNVKMLENERKLEKQREEEQRKAKLVSARQRTNNQQTESQGRQTESQHASSTASKPTSLLVPQKKKKKQKTSQHFPLKTHRAKAASAHKDQVLNDWNPEDMKAAIDQFAAQQLPGWPANTPKLSIR